MTGEAAELASKFDATLPSVGGAWTEWSDATRRGVNEIHSPKYGALITDHRWHIRFDSESQLRFSTSPGEDQPRLKWSPSNPTSELPESMVRGTFQLADGLHLGVAKPLRSGGYVIVHQPERLLEKRVSAVLGGMTSVSFMTLALTAAMLGICSFLIVGRFHNEVERERTRSLNDAMSQRQDLIRTRDAVIVGLARLAESRDPETGDHLDRICMYATTLASALMRHPEFMVEVTPSFVRLIGISAALHDIGKVGVEDRILLKPGRLTSAERTRMQEHSRIGGECLYEIERRLGRSNFLQMARDIAFSHHERWDGSGYPAGLAGEKIPLAARIVAIGDVYDALSSRRVYKEPLPHDRCAEIIREGAGSQFDPRIVEAWTEVAPRFREIAERHSNTRTPTFTERADGESLHPDIKFGGKAPIESILRDAFAVGS